MCLSSSTRTERTNEQRTLVMACLTRKHSKKLQSCMWWAKSLQYHIAEITVNDHNKPRYFSSCISNRLVRVLGCCLYAIFLSIFIKFKIPDAAHVLLRISFHIYAQILRGF